MTSRGSASAASHQDELRDASVEGFGGSVSSFPKLLVVTGLLNKRPGVSW